MTFKQFNDKVKIQFEQMQQHKLFRLNITGQQIWDAYIQGFSPEENPIFRDPNSSSHQCNNDQNFIRRYGNVVAIKDNKIVTMFDIDVTGTSYEGTVKNIKKVMSSGKVCDVFFETFNELNFLPYEKTSKNQKVFQLGHEKTLKKYTQEEADKFGVVNTTDIYTFHHFHVMLNSQFVDNTGKSIESIMGEYRSSYDVFQRAMKEIPLDTLELVRDLIVQGSLLNGDSYLEKVKTFIQLKKEYDSIPANEKDNWCWVTSYKLPIAKFRNELIGTLCVELAEGEELNKACLNWNKRADPINYMKASAPITQKQIAEAEKFVVENGYVESFNRRFATIDDINVSEIRHMNVNSKVEKEAGLFTGVKPSVSTRHKRSEFEGLEVVSIEKFMKEILPTCTSIELFLENRFDSNLVTLTTADKGKGIFKWNNLFSWTYNGNLTGKSEIKQEVKNKGGIVDAPFRFSLIWGDNDGDNSDLDAWCKQPNNEQIGFSTKFRKDSLNYFSSCGGQLDLDDRGYSQSIKVENIYFKNLQTLKEGTYSFWVNQYSAKKSKGFKAQIECNGELFDYEYSNQVSGNVKVADVTYKNGVFTFKHHLPETNSSKEMWSLNSGEFHKVNLVCLSPNFWGDNNIGNKHYFFMLEECHSNVPMRSFHNENLNGDLLTHRKVMEVLADTRRLEPTNKQLAGVGFNATVNDSIILKLTGTHKRTIKLTI
jgi:hypothetical protein